MVNLWQLRSLLSPLVGSTVSFTTEYSKVSGVLMDVKYDYVVLRVGSSFLYIPLASIQNIAY